MNFARIINITSEFLFEKYKMQYDIPEYLSKSGLLALELKNTSPTIKDFIRNSKKEVLFYINKYEEEKSLYVGSFHAIFDLTKSINDIDHVFGKEIIRCVKNYSEYDKNSFIIDTKVYDSNLSYIMGIVNVTPDSFSDGGRYFDRKSAVNHAVNLLNDGADFIDIGGESTKPGSEPVTLNEELDRVIPVIEEVFENNPNAMLSIDTTKSKTAYEALKRGVKIVNDISGLTFDPEIVNVVKEFNACLVIMHIKGTPKDMQVNPHYNDVVSEVYDFLEEKINVAIENGIKNICVDPGIGFGKRMEDNYELLGRLNEFKCLGYPILVGVSKKSFLGKVLNLDVNSREVPTLIAETYSMMNGAKIIRTHNVKNSVHSKKILKYFSNPGLVS